MSTTLTHQIRETTSRVSYGLFISSGVPHPDEGKPGDVWFRCCSPDDVNRVHGERQRTKRSKIFRYGGQVFLKRFNDWEEQNVVPASNCSDIPHPTREHWRLNTETFCWRKIVPPSHPPAPSVPPAPAPTPAPTLPSTVPPPAPPPAPPPIPMIPLNAWILPLIDEWRLISKLNASNSELGVKILQALLLYPQPLFHGGNPESELIVERHALTSTNRPTSMDVLKECYYSVTECMVVDCDVGQAEMADVDFFDVLRSLIQGKTSRMTLCSVLRIPDTSLSTEKCLRVPVHLQEKQGSTAHWRDNEHPSAWQYSLFPGAAIMYPNVDTWTSASFTSHFCGKTLWLFWPGTVDNYRILYSRTFSGEDHCLSPLYAIHQMTGLETLLTNSGDVDEEFADQPCWVTPAGTICCILTFSRLAALGGFYIHHTDWTQSADEASSNMLHLLRDAPQTADKNADMYLEEMLHSMTLWEKVAGDSEDEKVTQELESWVQKIKLDINNIIEQRQLNPVVVSSI